MKNINGIEVYENLKEIVDPRHSCLVVWDVQNGLVDRIFDKEEFMSSLKPLIEILRGKMPGFYTLITPLPRDFLSSWYFYSMMRRFNVDDVSKLPFFMPPGSQESMIPGAIEPEKDDVVLEKSFASIFLGTKFEFMLAGTVLSPQSYSPASPPRWALNQAYGMPPIGGFTLLWYRTVFLQWIERPMNVP